MPVPPMCLSALSDEILDTNNRTTFIGSLGETAELTCPIISDPPAENFHWYMERRQNETNEKLDLGVTTQNSFNLTIKSESMYGTIKCYAFNLIDNQSEPCEITVQPPGKCTYTHYEMNCNTAIMNYLTDNIAIHYQVYQIRQLIVGELLVARKEITTF